MDIAPFATEHFFARYEFNTPFQLCNSDCETITVGELLHLAEEDDTALENLGLGYTETAGDPELRQSVAGLYTSVSPQEVVMLGAPVEGIYLLAQAACGPGDEVVVLVPAYDALPAVCEHAVLNENVKRWELEPSEQGWRLNFDTLRALVTDRTKMIVVNFPHNPTGFQPSKEQLETITAIAEQAGALLFCDEMYYGLWHSGTRAVPSAADLSRSASVLGGLSKSYGLPGLRTGWLILRDKALRDKVINWKFYTTICASAPSEFLAKAALKAGDILVNRSIRQIEKNLDIAEAFFSRHADMFSWKRPMAGSVSLVEMGVPSVSAFAEKLAREAGVLILPAEAMGYHDRYMRMGFGRTGFSEALERFEEYVGKM